MRLEILGLNLNVRVTGVDEPALVFLHYWGGTSRTWSNVITSFEKGFLTVAYDARGWGKSDKATAGYRLADLADEAVAVVQTLGLQRYVLVGHSMGGKVAQLIASRNPEGLEGLILVAPAPPTPVHFPEQVRHSQIHAYDSSENVLQTIGLLTARMPDSVVMQQIVEDSTSGSREATLAWPTSSILEDISAELSKIDVPTLVIAGELDQLDSIEQHKREVVSRISNAQLAIVKGSGHLIPIDEPKQLAELIAAFVKALRVS